jgi:hypothetical protein
MRIGMCTLAIATALSVPSQVSAQDRELHEPRLWMEFTPWDPKGAGQCEGRIGQQFAYMGDWTDPIRIDTDNRPGGCLLRFALQDPESEIAGLQLVFWYYTAPDSDAGQCEPKVGHITPIRATQLDWTHEMKIDTDDRPGGCYQEFSIGGRGDFVLDVQQWTDGDIGQCPFAKPKGQFNTARGGKALILPLLPDSRPGGCWEAFRLRKLGPGE